ncbi:hypothetical protein AMATHDRAFT_83634 [Amanita thiersii Skay4041]|uniref:Protein BIG1 n=1 Tax=Amanita thiersii Skay4041 TaxID=703135 RepID=A0A2A9NYP4_9AGAR|nr:hypothetical protein AMATHDRAFT_83634 [Amanita thiersii Skay4041]
MKFNAISLLALGTALVSVQASPLRVVVVTNNQDLSQKIRFGHAVPNTNEDIGRLLPPSTTPFLAGTDGHLHAQFVKKKPCFMRKMHMKAIEISNAFRQAFGMPLIEPSHREPDHTEGHVFKGTYKILPFIGTEPTFIEVKGQKESGELEATTRGGDAAVIRPFISPDNATVHRNGTHRNCWKRIAEAPFLKRLSVALMSLGPWEGRAVAFVLGCGLGVLIRMMWVLALVTFRCIKGNKRQEVEYAIIEEYIEEDPEDIVVPPPTYTFPIDEKVDAKNPDTN